MENGRSRRSVDELPFSNLPLYYLLLVILLAFGLRLVHLNDLPLSLSLDEAVDGLDALQLFRLRWLTPFLQNNFGRETLFFYLQGLILQLGGISFFSLRFSSVLAGTLTIPLLYLVGQRLGREHSTLQGSNSHLVGLLAATGLVVSYWHIYFSRVSLRAILLPPLLLGLIWCFWQGWYPLRPQSRRARRVWLSTAGFLLGLSFYTYLAARLLPLLFIIFMVLEILRSTSARISRLMDGLVFGASATLTALPLLLYFQQNPQALNSRTQAISIFAGSNPLETLFSNFLALLRLHFLGNTWLGHWPALDLVSALGLFLGLTICLYHVKKPVSQFLLLWWVIGTAPILLSRQDWEATTTLLRGIMAWPALYLLSAIGLTALTKHLGGWIQQHQKMRFSPLLSASLHLHAPLLLLLIFGGLTTIYAYFFVWANTYNNFSDHPPQIARYLNSQTSQLSLTPLQFYGESVVNFLLQAHYPNLRNTDSTTLRRLLAAHQPSVYLLPNEATAESVFVLLEPAAHSQGTAYLLPPLTPAQVEALSNQTRQTVPLSTVLDGEQEPIAQVYPLAAEAPFLPTGPDELSWRSLQASFNHDILLANYRVEPAVVKPGQTVTLFLNWQTQRPVDGEYDLFVHLFEVSQEQRWGQLNVPLAGVLYNAHRWPVGLTVPDVLPFTLPAAAPDGVYRFELGLYYPATQQRLPVTSSANSPAADRLILGKVHVWRQPPAPPQYPLANLHFGDSIALIGFDLPTSTLSPGQILSFALHWQALTTIPQNYTVFTHLLDAAGKLKVQQDNPPQQGRYPTSWWDPGEIVIDSYSLALPPDLAPGLYTLQVGWYEPETGQRLLLKNGDADFVNLPNFIKLQN